MLRDRTSSEKTKQAMINALAGLDAYRAASEQMIALVNERRQTVEAMRCSTSESPNISASCSRA